jgi:hypothetical protein
MSSKGLVGVKVNYSEFLRMNVPFLKYTDFVSNSTG